MKRHPFSLAFVLVLPAFAMAVEHAHEVWADGSSAIAATQ
jgi:hypothetical protein